MGKFDIALAGEGVLQPNFAISPAAFVNPEFSDVDAQTARVLATALDGCSVNPIQASMALGIYCLSDAVLKLRKAKWPVIAERLCVTNTFGEACAFELKRLPERSICCAGEEGRQFTKRVFSNMNALRFAE